MAIAHEKQATAKITTKRQLKHENSYEFMNLIPIHNNNYTNPENYYNFCNFPVFHLLIVTQPVSLQLFVRLSMLCSLVHSGYKLISCKSHTHQFKRDDILSKTPQFTYGNSISTLNNSNEQIKWISFCCCCLLTFRRVIYSLCALPYTFFFLFSKSEYFFFLFACSTEIFVFGCVVAAYQNPI